MGAKHWVGEDSCVLGLTWSSLELVFGRNQAACADLHWPCGACGRVYVPGMWQGGWVDLGSGRGGLALAVIAPTLQAAAAGDSTGVTKTGAYAQEGARWRGGLAVVVPPPALHTAVGLDATGVVAARAHALVCTRRWSGLAVIVIAPTLHAAVAGDSTGV